MTSYRGRLARSRAKMVAEFMAQPIRIAGAPDETKPTDAKTGRPERRPRPSARRPTAR